LYPEAQLQVKPPELPLQVPPFWHGLGKHGSKGVSIKERRNIKGMFQFRFPDTHKIKYILKLLRGRSFSKLFLTMTTSPSQSREETKNKVVPFVPQSSPVNPETQLQVKPSELPLQVPPFWHGLGKHGSKSVSIRITARSIIF